MTIAIVGSRGYINLQRVVLFVNSLPVGTKVVSGSAPGVDRTAERAARSRGLEVLSIPADWDRYGKSAGYRRNVDIVNISDKVVAFWNGLSSGTRHALDIAIKQGKPVKIYRDFNNRMQESTSDRLDKRNSVVPVGGKSQEDSGVVRKG